MSRGLLGRVRVLREGLRVGLVLGPQPAPPGKTGDAVDSYARLLAEPPPDPVEAATRFLLSALPPLRG